MAADFIINVEHKVVFSYAWGTLALADIRDHRSRLLQDARYVADFRQIMNVTDVTNIELSSEEIYFLAKEPVFASESRRALVAGPLLHYGLSRIFHAYSDGQTISIFRQIEEAVGWLDLPLEVAVQAFEEIRHTHGLT